MKFIRTVGGSYINAAHVWKFYISKRTVYAATKDINIIADGSTFKTDEEAQKWLDELIDELERGED